MAEKTGMHSNFYIQTIQKSPFYKTPPRSFWDLIQETVQELVARFPEWPRLVPAESLNKLIIAHCLISADEYNELFTHYKKIALKFPRSPSIFWRTVVLGVCSPETEKIYLKSVGLHNSENYQTNLTPRTAPHKETPEITPKPKKPIRLRTGIAWRNRRVWKDARESTRAVALFLFKKAIRPRTWPNFPYRKISVETIALETGYEERQVRRAIHDAQRRGFIYRLMRGRPLIGSSLYLVFWTPAQSKAYQVKIEQAKNKGPRPERLRPTYKRILRHRRDPNPKPPEDDPSIK